MKIERPETDNCALTTNPFNVLQKVAVESILSSKGPNELYETLKSFLPWVWDRGDLMCWSPVLNMFDEVLQAYIERSGLLDLPGNEPATQKETAFEFIKDWGEIENLEPHLTSTLIIEILRCSHLILESSAAKPMYNSLDRAAILLDSTDERIIAAALPIIMLHAFAARKARKPCDQESLAEIQTRLSLLAVSPAGALGSSPNEVKSPMTFYSDATWTHSPEYAQQVTSINKETGAATTVSITNNMLSGLVQSSSSRIGYNVADERRRNHAISSLLTKMGVAHTDWRILRHRCRVLFAMNQGIDSRRRIVDVEIFALMTMLSLNPVNFQLHIALNTKLLVEAAFLLRCHRHLTCSTLTTVIDLWVTILHERVQAKAVSNHLQLNAPHGLLAELVRFHLSDASLLPPGCSQMEPLPELLYIPPTPSGKQNASAAVASLSQKAAPAPSDCLLSPDIDPPRRETDKPTQEDQAPTPCRPLPLVLPDQTDDHSQSNQPKRLKLTFTSAYEAYLTFSKATPEERQVLAVADDQARKHSEVTTAILDLLHETLHNPSSATLAALTHSSVVASILSVFRNKDYRYVQTVVSALRLMEVFYEQCPQSLKSALRELDAVAHTGRRTRYECAKVVHLIENLKKTGACDNLFPWMAQSEFCDPPERLNEVMTTLKRGRGVPCHWSADKREGITDEDVFFWQSMEEMANRRCLLVALVKEGPVFHYYLAGEGEVAGGISDVFVKHFSQAYRTLIHEYKVVGFPVFTATLQSLSDMLTEEPTMHPFLANEGITTEIYKVLEDPEVLRAEPCLNVVPSLLLSFLHHNAGMAEMKKRDFRPIRDMIQICSDGSLVFFDRVSGISSSIGHVLEDMIRNDSAELLPIVMEECEKMLAKLLEESESLPLWQVKKSAHVNRILDSKIAKVRHCQLRHLDPPKAASHRYFADRLANVARMIHGLLQGASQTTRLELFDKLLKYIYPLCGIDLNPLATVPSLPPIMQQMFSLTHPAFSLLKQLLITATTTSVFPNVSFASKEDQFFGKLFRLTIESAMSVMEVLQNAPGNTSSFLGLSMKPDQIFADQEKMSPEDRQSLLNLRRRMVTDLSALTGCLSILTSLNRESNVVVSSRLPWVKTILASLGSVVVAIGPVFDILTRLVYQFTSLEAAGDCPNPIILKCNLHEHVILRANKIFLTLKQNDALVQSACFRSPGSDPISAGINRVHLTANCFLWSSLCSYAYSCANPAMETSVRDDRNYAIGAVKPPPPFEVMTTSRNRRLSILGKAQQF